MGISVKIKNTPTPSETGINVYIVSQNRPFLTEQLSGGKSM